MLRPKEVQLIGEEIALSWEDGSEGYIKGSALRAASPSASTKGERDIFGNQYGGETNPDYSGVTVTSWEFVGNYAIRFHFSDGHSTGIYGYELLKELGDG